MRTTAAWLTLLLLCACGPPTPPAPADGRTGRRVVVIGWDGADWEIARPLMEAGRMPHLRALAERGAVGELRSLIPTLSPLLWTSVATGRPPEVHGVLDFLEPGPAGGPPRPVGSAARQVPALWEMAAASGLTAGVVAWWATHPASDRPGFMVSDRFAYTLLDRPSGGVGGELPAGTVAPAVLEKRLRALRVPPDRVPAERMGALRTAGEAAPEAEADLARVVAATLSYQAVLLDLLADGPPDLLLAYFQGIDQVSHRFMDCEAPALPFCPPGERERFAGTVRGFYELQDSLLGDLLRALPPGVTVLLLSDHGFLHGESRPRYSPPDIQREPGRWHRREGIFVLAGPDVVPADVGTVDLLQIAPTVLRLLGLPVSREMEGTVVERALSEGFLRSHPPASIDSWQDDLRKAAAPVEGEEAARRQVQELTALGYVSGAGARGAAAGRSVAAEVNLASRLLQTERLADAAAALKRALDRSPDYPPAWIALSEVRSRQGRPEEAAECLSRAVTLEGAGADPSIFLRWAVAAGGGVDLDPRAVEAFDQSLLARPESPELQAARGLLLASAGDLPAALPLLRRALDRAPALTEALAGLFGAAGDGVSPAELEERLLRAREAGSTSPMPDNWLALTLERGGEAGEAERLLREAAARWPEHAATRSNLGGLLGRSGRFQESVEEFRRALQIEPRSVEARVGLATALVRLGRLEEARDALIDGEPPADARLLNTLALVYRDLGMPEEAVEALKSSLRLRPDQPQAHRLLDELGAGE